MYPTGQGVNVGDVLRWTGTTWTAQAITGAVETFDAAASNGVLILYGGGGPTGDFLGSIVVPGTNFTVTKMRCILNQLGAAGDVRMGIYSSAGLLLGETGLITPVAIGIQEGTLVTPVSLDCGLTYYMGVWTNSNGAQFQAMTGTYAAAGPTLSFEAVNVTGVGGLPADVSASLTNKQTTAMYVNACSG